MNDRIFASHEKLASVRDGGHLSGALFVLLLGVGCVHQTQPKPAAPLNLSTPKDAALTFVHAIGAGDTAAARAACLGTDAQKRWIDSVSEMVHGLREVDEALLERFGGAAERLDIDIRDALKPWAEHAEAEVNAATFQENENEARMIPLGRPMSIQVPYAQMLRRDKGTWRVDLPAVYAARPRLKEASESPDYHLLVNAGKELQKLAAQIRSGKFKTLQSARQAIAERMRGINTV